MSFLNTASKNPALYPADQGESRSAVCKAHNKPRLKKFLEAKPIFDAQGAQVGTEYSCLSTSICATNNTSNMSLGNVDLSRATAAPRALLDGVAAQEALRAQMNGTSGVLTSPTNGGGGAGGAPGKKPAARYYDFNAGKEDDRKKICFNCGLQGHEKPQCPNKFCFTCHNVLHEGSVCETPEYPSPFALGLSESTQREFMEMVKEDLEDVRCLTCGAMGHLDCRPKKVANPLHQDSCSFCATKNHTSVRCPQRMMDRFHLNLQRRFPDLVAPVTASSGGGQGGIGEAYYSAQQQQSLGAVGGGGGGGDTCFNCGQSGHMKRECPVPRQGYGRGGGGGFGGGGRGGGGNYGGRGNFGGGAVREREDFSLNARQQDRVWNGRGGGQGGQQGAQSRYDDRRQDDRRIERRDDRYDSRDNRDRRDAGYNRNGNGGSGDYGRQKRDRGYDSDDQDRRRRRY